MASSSTLDVRQLLDLEAAVDRGGYESEEDEEGTIFFHYLSRKLLTIELVDEGFINDGDDDEGQALNYHAVNIALDNEDHSDHDSLFSGDGDVDSQHDSLFSGDDEDVEVEGTGELVESVDESVDDTMQVDDSGKDQAREVWIVNCKVCLHTER
jgi:hypothetical protein